MIHPGNEFALLDPIDGKTYLRVVGDISLQKDILLNWMHILFSLMEVCMTSQLESKLRIVSSGEEISVITPIISSLAHGGHPIVLQTSKSNLILPIYLIFGM